MSVWMCCPSARPVEEVKKWAAAWRERGYKIAIARDQVDMTEAMCDQQMVNIPYAGYAQAVNCLVAALLLHESDAEWFIAAGDDIFPDPNKSAEEIALECHEHFANELRIHSTFGVMQPTGDPWSDRQGRIIERIAGSAWYGREYCQRINQGRGPLWPEYTHMFVDEEAQLVAQKYGVFWQRPDLTQMHMHWGRPKEGEKFGDIKNMPEFLKEANSPEHWKKYKGIFEARKAAGFPGSEPL